MPRFHLSFDYPHPHGGLVVGNQIVIRDSLEEAAKYIARQRSQSKIHIRNQYFVDGEMKEIALDFEFPNGAA